MRSCKCMALFFCKKWGGLDLKTEEIDEMTF